MTVAPWVLAFVAAKASSARLPGKCTRPFAGGPCLASRAVRLGLEAKALGLVDTVLLSRDAYVVSAQVRKEVGETGRLDGWLDVEDHDEPAPHAPGRVARLLRAHLAAWGEAWPTKDLPRPDLVCVLWPTSPLRTLRHVVEAYRLLDQDTDVVLSVTPFRQSPRLACLVQERRVVRVGESLPDGPHVVHCGTVIWVRAEHLLSGGGFYDGRVRPYCVASEEAIDVDTQADFDYAAFLLARRDGAGQ